MKGEIIKITYPGYTGNCTIETFFFNPSRELITTKRPLILILPGGGYEFLSDRESESVAFQFSAKGYNTAIVHYSVFPASYPTQLLEVASCVKYMKDNADALNIDKDRIFLYGASAGGHAAALFSTGYFRDEVTSVLNVSPDYLKPAGMILAYPVITSGKFSHRSSIEHLLNEKKDDEQLFEYVSIENRVDKMTPPAFIWHTVEDGLVPVENSLLLAESMQKAGVPFELHIFPSGGHGLALANEVTRSPWGNEINESCAQWVDLCIVWLRTNFGPLYKEN